MNVNIFWNIAVTFMFDNIAIKMHVIVYLLKQELKVS